MIKLNLRDLAKSEIKYKISNFPDGQQDIVIEPRIHTDKFGGAEVQLAELANLGISKTGVQIQARFNSFKDLELILCANMALKRLGVKEIHLYIPYLLGARSDREFTEGGNSYLVDVVAPVINSCEFQSVTCIDVHSDVAAACIKNFKGIDNIDFGAFVIEALKLMGIEPENMVIVSPDAGSLKKCYKLAKTFGIRDIALGSKYRDTLTGEITKTDVTIPDREGVLDKTFVIFDDICDGGKTFIELAKSLKEKQVNGAIMLAVTHGIFSKGLTLIEEHIDHIFCTNSVKGKFQIQMADWVHVMEVI